MKTCTFFGHKNCPDSIKQVLTETIEQQIVSNSVQRFYVRHNGNFDRLVVAQLTILKAKHPTIECFIVLDKHPVLPRLTYRLSTLYPFVLDNVPPQFKIDRRNHWMVNESDVVLTYIRFPFGGAAKFTALAQKKCKTVLKCPKCNIPLTYYKEKEEIKPEIELTEEEKGIVRAHGIAKGVYDLAKDKNITLFDLTCPNVLKIHDEACKLVDEGYFVVLTAQKEHPEAIGTISFCGNNSFILENEEQLEELISVIKESKIGKVAVISQTTYSMAKFDKLSKMLVNELDDIDVLVNNTICSATELRQKETSELSLNVDAMIIIGGKNSSNTKKLFEIASTNCSNSFIIETVEDIKNEDLSLFNKVGIMAGASTPKESIDAVVDYLKNM